MTAPDTIFNALADPTRRSVYEQLVRGEKAVGDLTARFNVSQPAISQHLAALRRAGLVSQRREGRFIYYKAKPSGLRPLVNWMNHYASFWEEHLDKLNTLLRQQSGRNT
jgi:DNA-binding transcriptional ArsR family regulator